MAALTVRIAVDLTAQVDLAPALDHDPFSGDETAATPLADKIVVFRKTKPRGCQSCKRDIVKGAIGRSLTERNDEEHTIETHRWCSACTAAMALPNGLDLDATEQRLSLDGNPFDPWAWLAWLKETSSDLIDDEDHDGAYALEVLRRLPEAPLDGVPFPAPTV